MRIGVLGTGMVGTTLAGKLRELGHQVQVGSRDGSKGDGTFAAVAAHGELLLNCTAGTASLAALELAGDENLRGKVLVDVANPLDFSGGFPPPAQRLQRRQPGRADSATVSRRARREGAEYDRCPGDGRSEQRSGRAHNLRRRGRHLGEGAGRRAVGEHRLAARPGARPRRHRSEPRFGDVPAALAVALLTQRLSGAEHRGSTRRLTIPFARAVTKSEYAGQGE